MSNSNLVTCKVMSPNHSGKRTHKIDRITPHCVVGQLSASSIGRCFTSTRRQASCNYGIGKEGGVCLIVDEANRSWCSSSANNDQRAVTIECASDKAEPYAFNSTVYNKLIDLCVDICKRNGKKKLLWIPDKNKVTKRLGCSTLKNDKQASHKVTNFPKTPFSVKVIVNDLNYRSRPSSKAPVKGKTGKGVFTIVKVNNGWGKLKSGKGWIYLKNTSYCNVLGSTSS